MNLPSLITALRSLRLNAADTNVIVQAIATLQQLEEDANALRQVVEALQVEVAVAKVQR